MAMMVLQAYCYLPHTLILPQSCQSLPYLQSLPQSYRSRLHSSLSLPRNSPGTIRNNCHHIGSIFETRVLKTLQGCHPPQQKKNPCLFPDLVLPLKQFTMTVQVDYFDHE